jgi:hypothetical protein
MALETFELLNIDTTPSQTSIKELRAELKALKDEMANLDEGSDAFLEIANKAGEVKHKIDEINESVKGASADIGDMLGNTTRVAAGITGAFQAAEGAMRLFGVESENVTEAIARLQGVMAMTQGLAAIDDGIKAITKLGSTITSTTKIAKLFKTVLQPKVFLVITAAVAGLVAIWNKWGDSIKETFPFLGKTTKQLEAEKKAAEEAAAAKKKQADAEEDYRKKVGSAIQGTLSDYKLLQAQYKRLQTDYQKMRWIENNKEAFDKLGISVKNLKDAEDKFVNNTDAVVQALIKRAIAAAKQQQLTELAAKYTEAKVKAEQEYEKKKVGAYDEVSYRKEYSQRLGMQSDKRTGKWIWTEEGAKKENEKIKNKLFAEAEEYQKQMNALAAEIADEMSIDNILKGINNDANGGTGGTATTIVDDAKQKALNAIDIEIEALKRKYNVSSKEFDDDKQKQIDYNKEVLVQEQKRLELLKDEPLAYAKQLTTIHEINEEIKELGKPEAVSTGSTTVEKDLNEAYDIRLEQLKRTAKTNREYLEGELAIEKERLSIFEAGTIAYEQQLTTIYELEKELKEAATSELETLTNSMNEQFEILKATIDLFGESSLGFTGEWSKAFADFQLVFNQSMDLVKNKGENTWRSYTDVAASALKGIGTVLNTLSEEQDAQTEEGFEQQKKLQIAATLMNMFAGIASAWTSALNPANSWMTIWGQIAMGTATSAMLATMAGLQIDKIKNTQFEGGGNTGNVSGSAVSSIVVPPSYYSNAVQGAQTESTIKDSRVYVVESDITGVMGRVNVQETENVY